MFLVFSVVKARSRGGNTELLSDKPLLDVVNGEADGRY